jgi:hypothetical protein
MSARLQIPEGLAGIARWVGVFLVGFMIGYAMMSLVIEEPSAEELSEASMTPVAQPAPQPAPIQLPALDVDAPSDEADHSPSPIAGEVTELEPEVIDTVAEAAPEIPRPWWEACQGRRCRLDFGGIRGNLTIRKASLVHGSTIDWATDMGSKPRIYSLPTERPLEVQVEAIAMSPEGVPTAAEIVWSRKGRLLRGVITLDLGEPGKRIVMHP